MAFQKILKGVLEPEQFENSFTVVYWGFECCQLICMKFHIIYEFFFKLGIWNQNI